MQEFSDSIICINELMRSLFRISARGQGVMRISVAAGLAQRGTGRWLASPHTLHRGSYKKAKQAFIMLVLVSPRASDQISAPLTDKSSDALARSRMTEFQVNVTVEVDQVGNGLCIQTPVDLQIGYNKGQWQSRSVLPPFEANAAQTLEAAVVAGARQAKTELQAAVIERPRPIARITPADIPALL